MSRDSEGFGIGSKVIASEFVSSKKNNYPPTFAKKCGELFWMPYHQISKDMGTENRFF